MDRVKYIIKVNKVEWNTAKMEHAKKISNDEIMRFDFETLEAEERSYSNLVKMLEKKYLDEWMNGKTKEDCYQKYLTSYVIRSSLYLDDGYMETFHFDVIGL